MGVFEQFPYSNMQNVNLDWVLQLAKKLETALNGDFSSYIQTWIDDNYSKLFLEASYDEETETIYLTKGVNK